LRRADLAASASLQGIRSEGAQLPEALFMSEQEGISGLDLDV